MDISGYDSSVSGFWFFTLLKKRVIVLSESMIQVPKFTLKRLPHYYRFVCECAEHGLEYFSSEEMAKAVQINAVQIRRDLMLFDALGTPGVGYHVEKLKNNLEEILGLKNVNEAVLIGVGKLGRAMIDYPGFKRYGLRIVALFDNDPGVIGTKINSCQIFAISELDHIVGRLNIRVGIITVPAPSAQNAADRLIHSGIKAIWNFAPVLIRVPDDVVVRDEDLAAGLATLCYFIAGK